MNPDADIIPPESSAETVPGHSPAPSTKAPRRRIGRFIVGHATFHHNWRSLLPLMAQCVVLRAESLYHLDGIEYLALCEAFDEIEVGAVPPTYDVRCRSDQETGREAFTFHRTE